jgi:hypothetical protein
VVKSFFFSSLALCIQNKSSGSCCNYLRTPHTTVREALLLPPSCCRANSTTNKKKQGRKPSEFFLLKKQVQQTASWDKLMKTSLTMDNQTEETWTWRQQKPRTKTKAATAAAEFEGLRELRQNTRKKKVWDQKIQRKKWKSTSEHSRQKQNHSNESKREARSRAN